MVSSCHGSGRHHEDEAGHSRADTFRLHDAGKNFPVVMAIGPLSLSLG